MNKRRKVKLRNRRLTIDMRINQLIEEYNAKPKTSLGIVQPIIHWAWHGEPGCYSPRATLPKDFDTQVFTEIVQAGAVECMVSESEYVREAKKWQMNRQAGITQATPDKYPPMFHIK